MFFSKSFRKILTTINTKIARDLLAVLDSDLTFKFSYVQVKDADVVTVLPINRAIRIEGTDEEDFTYPTDDSILWGEKYRQPIRIGALVTSILPNSNNQKELELFINQYRAQIDVFKYNIKIIRGEEIRNWYHVKTYFNPNPGVVDRDDLPEGASDPRTPLMKSCLKQPEKQPFFDIYTKNVDQVGLLIMTDQNNKLRARAIVWFDCYVADNPENPTKGALLDRIYYTNESDVNIFINYAKEQGWWYKPSQQKEIYSFVMNDAVCNKSITTRLKVHGEFNYYPYVDTMCFYTPATGRLSSTRGKPAMKNGSYIDRYQLHNTNGSKKRLSTDR